MRIVMSWGTWFQTTLQVTFSIILFGAALAIAVGLIVNSIRGGKS